MYSQFSATRPWPRTRRLSWTSACCVLLSSLLLYSATVWPQTEKKDKEEQPTVLAGTLEDIGRKLDDRWRDDQEALAAWTKVIQTITESAAKCIPTAEQNLKALNEKIATLGLPTKGAPAEVVRQRKELDDQKTTLENRIATCKVLVLRSEELLPRIAALQKRLEAERLLAHGPSILALLRGKEVQPGLWVSGSRAYFRERSALAHLSAMQWALLAFAIAITGAIGGLIRQQLMCWVGRHRWHRNLSSRMGRCLVTSIAHYLPHLFVSMAAAGFFFFATHHIQPIAVANVFAYGLPVYFVLLMAIHTLLAPFSPAEPFLRVPKEAGRPLAAHLKVFAALVFLAYLLFATFLAQGLSEAVLLLARDAFVVAFFINLTWALWWFSRIPAMSGTRWIQIALALALVTALVAEFLGFRNLALAAVEAVVGTLVALGIFGLVRQLLNEMFDGLNTGRHRWHRRIRKLFALNADDPVPGLVWVRIITSVFLWAVLLMVISRFWGVPDVYLLQAYAWVTKGFTVGLLHVNPARILLAIITLTVLLALSGWIRSRLRRGWLLSPRMDRGAREASVTMSGYVGVAVAILVALAVAGFEFTNLAIIAGALSVGIGFGLQAIVNNFVSGLILLFERPIKTGDWIVVGNTEGYVKKIRIRSTMIQTFDRADVIVPNSDLVSNQVTNWMLHDPHGRIRVPVGVAYGSDTEKVREVMLQVARGHSAVITDGRAPEPRVLFVGFGDSSLDFELWCHIQQIDIRRIVISDLNFAIEKAFREHGIEIPYPHRDIHVRDWTAGTSRRTPRPAAESGENPDSREAKK